MTECSIVGKRAAIFATRMRFSPESQIARDTAIDKLIEKQLFLLHDDQGIARDDIVEKGGICQ